MVMVLGIFGSLNDAAFQTVKAIASPTLNFIMYYWAESFYVVLAALFLYLYFKKDKNLWPFATAVVMLFVIDEILKALIREPRPCSVQSLSWINSYNCESGYAFPSAHASVLTGLPLFLGNYKYVRIGYIIWLVVVLAGRIYLGNHYLTDVIAGAAISIVVSFAIYKFRDRINIIADEIIGYFVKLIPVHK